MSVVVGRRQRPTPADPKKLGIFRPLVTLLLSTRGKETGLATALDTFVRRLTRGMAAATRTDQSDRELVEQFLARGDEATFETLVRRHGPMVYRVCWRVLQHAQDAEDAFQAAFLLLAEKLRTVRKRESLASWLHGVAHRVALYAKGQAARRRRHEQNAPPQPTPSDEVTWKEFRAVLDSEMGQLSEKWRLPLILCYLEGRTHDEAAGQLKWSKNTLRRRLDEGREALGRRLRRRGVWPATAFSAVLLSDCVVAAALPPRLIDSTVGIAARVAAGQAAMTVASAKVGALIEGVHKAMLLTKLKLATAVLLVSFAVLALGALVGVPALTAELPQVPERGKSAGQQHGNPQDVRKPIAVRDNAFLRQLAWSADGTTVATVAITFDIVEVTDSDGNNPQKLQVPTGTLKLWDPSTGKLQRELKQEQYTDIDALAFSSDKETVAFVTSRSFAPPVAVPRRQQPDIGMLDAKTWKPKYWVEDVNLARVQHWSAAVFSPDGKRLALGGYQLGYCVKLWDVQNKKLLGGTKSRESKPVADPSQPVDPDYKTAVTCLAFSPDGKMLAAGDRDAKIRLFDGMTGEAKGVLDDHRGRVTGVAFPADGKTLLSTSEDKTVKIWDIPSGKVRKTLEGHKGEILSAALSADGKLLATAGNFAERKGAPWQVEIILWDAKTGDRKRTVSDVTGPIIALAFSPDGRTLAAAGGMAYDLKDGGKATGEMTLIPLTP
jgi:RNA polymerase sigma factor (sigma-70 family)